MQEIAGDAGQFKLMKLQIACSESLTKSHPSMGSKGSSRPNSDPCVSWETGLGGAHALLWGLFPMVGTAIVVGWRGWDV